MRTLLEHLVNRVISKHPLPWHIEYDWTVEVYDANNELIDKFQNDIIAREFIEIAKHVHGSNKLAAAETKAFLAEFGIDLENE